MKKSRNLSMRDSLGQRVGLMIETFVVDHAMFFIVLFLLAVAIGDFYARFFKINRNTDHVDIAARYNEFQLRKRYRSHAEVFRQMKKGVK
jgi:Na+-transporting methylmalonyl-CoA/oxaloacetate decarboxylase gamma subunit